MLTGFDPAQCKSEDPDTPEPFNLKFYTLCTNYQTAGGRSSKLIETDCFSSKNKEVKERFHAELLSHWDGSIGEMNISHIKVEHEHSSQSQLI